MIFRRTVTAPHSAHRVFAYLSDFTTTTEWDPGTVCTVRTSGDGGLGSEYLNTSRFAGRETQLTYVVTELVPNRRIVLRGENKTVIANATMTFQATSDGTEVTYSAEFTFKGVTRLIAPMLRPAFIRIGDAARDGMAAALTQLPSTQMRKARA